MNAPVPPTNDGDSLKHSSQFPSGYSQSFNSQSEHSVEQPDNQQEALQSGEGRGLGWACHCVANSERKEKKG